MGRNLNSGPLDPIGKSESHTMIKESSTSPLKFNMNQKEEYNVVASVQNNVIIEPTNTIDSWDKFSFPPESAPKQVKEAFNQLNESEKFNLHPLSILLSVRQLTPGGFDTILKRINGQSVSTEEHLIKTLEIYNSFFNRVDFSYIEFTNELIVLWEKNKSINYPETYEKKMEAFTKFKIALRENGVK